MTHEWSLSKANRLKLAQAFRGCKRVDFSIDCVIEGQLGKVYVDDPARPTAYGLTTGPFWYFAGNPQSPGGLDLIKSIPAYNLFMPSTQGWLELTRKVFGEDLHPIDRYSFSSKGLSISYLDQLIEHSPYCAVVTPLTVEMAAQLASLPESYLELTDFDSVEDFIERSIGFAALDGETVMGVAYGSLVCSLGIEVSIYVEELYRQKGIATALASRLLQECLQRGLRPNWDAANPESCKLALKLGYEPMGSYEAYYHTDLSASRG